MLPGSNLWYFAYKGVLQSRLGCACCLETRVINAFDKCLMCLVLCFILVLHLTFLQLPFSYISDLLAVWRYLPYEEEVPYVTCGGTPFVGRVTLHVM